MVLGNDLSIGVGLRVWGFDLTVWLGRMICAYGTSG